MSYRIVSESEFHEKVKAVTQNMQAANYGCVTGPGRSGAIAAVYVSHKLGIPFIPYGQDIPAKLQPVLVVDTASWTGRTARKAARRYNTPSWIAFYKERPVEMVKFWYEEHL